MDNKLQVIDPIIDAFRQYELVDNDESSTKKLIWQIPFSRVKVIQELLSQLEAACSAFAYVDIEINSLEDAYLNIAKEEEKLLENLARDGMQRYSQKVDRKFSLNVVEEQNAPK